MKLLTIHTIILINSVCYFGVNGYSPASHRGSPGSRPGHSMRDLW
jgi:hypothetical protein